MPFVAQLLIFGITGLLLYIGVYYGTPFLIRKGVPLVYSFWFCLWFPVMMLFPASILVYHLEGHTWTIQSVLDRLRFHALASSDWLWVSGAIVLTIVFDQMLEPLGKVFAEIPVAAAAAFFCSLANLAFKFFQKGLSQKP